MPKRRSQQVGVFAADEKCRKGNCCQIARLPRIANVGQNRKSRGNFLLKKKCANTGKGMSCLCCLCCDQGGNDEDETEKRKKALPQKTKQALGT